jgi:DNA-binding HxlR family transcriptional regulator
MATAPRPGLCARFHRAVELIGARWTGAILQVLMNGPVRYADLRAAVPDISDRMLCERLRELEEAAIVVRTVSAEPPVRVDYSLSDKGKALEPALDAIGRWAERWGDAAGPAKGAGRRQGSGIRDQGSGVSKTSRPKARKDSIGRR